MIGAGINTVRLPATPPGVHTLVLRARSRGGAVDEDRLRLLMGGRLRLGLARRLTEGDIRFSDARYSPSQQVLAADAATEYVGRCRQPGRRRADCAVRDAEDDSCVEILYMRLTSTGLLRQGSYRCRPGGPFREQIPRGSKSWPFPLL